MTLYQVPKDLKDYHGCGKAWAAIKDGQVVALRYMGDCPRDWPDKPAWIAAVEQAADGLDESFLPTAGSSKALTAIAQAASACEDCPAPPRRERYRPAELLSMARAALAAADTANFAAYRRKCREELAKLGEVVSGECSCFEFMAR